MDEKKDLIELQNGITLVDILLRLNALEEVLIKKNVINSSEFGEALKNVLDKMNNAIKDAGHPDLAKIMNMKDGQ